MRKCCAFWLVGDKRAHARLAAFGAFLFVEARLEASLTGRIDDHYRSIAVEFGLKNPIRAVKWLFHRASIDSVFACFAF
jgi:hypothetical protein